jgi:hypothetical protein
MTIQQRLIAVMKAKGYPQVTDTRTLKYVVFRRNDGKFYYLGKAGALRVGPTVTGSLSLSAAKYLERYENDPLLQNAMETGASAAFWAR